MAALRCPQDRPSQRSSSRDVKLRAYPPTPHRSIPADHKNSFKLSVSQGAQFGAGARTTSLSPRGSIVAENPEPWALATKLNVCNTILGITGVVSAICFGVVTIVQSNFANKEARRANVIAATSLSLSRWQICIQLANVSVSQ